MCHAPGRLRPRRRDPTLARRAKPITESYLRNLAAWYLERHDAPPRHLRKILLKRVERAVRELDADRAEATAIADRVVAAYVEAGLVSDQGYAERAIRRLRARGQSRRRIRSYLFERAVPREVIDEVMAEEGEEDEVDPERIAAIRYIRRRRFGPFARPDRPGDPRKQLASMARAGFGYAVSRDVLQGEREALEDELGVGW